MEMPPMGSKISHRTKNHVVGINLAKGDDAHISECRAAA